MFQLLICLLCVLSIVKCQDNDKWDDVDYEIFDLNDSLQKLIGVQTTFYEFLEIDSNADSKTVASAYRKMSLKYHPDKSKEKDLEMYSKLLTSIATILKDSESRGKYDYHLQKGFPIWRGSGYYYKKYRPGLLSVLIMIIIFISNVQYWSGWGIYLLGKYVENEESTAGIRGSKKKEKFQTKKLSKPMLKDVLLFQIPFILMDSIQSLFKKKKTQGIEGWIELKKINNPRLYHWNMNDLGPLKSVVNNRKVENMRNGRMRMRNLVMDDIHASQAGVMSMDGIEKRVLDVRENEKWDGRVMAKKEYQYVPPAAKRFYLWDSTPTGVTYCSQTQNDISLAQINFIAQSNVLAVIERHGFKEPGFLLGFVDLNEDSKVVFDRFDMGRNNNPTMVLKGDEIMKVFFNESRSTENYRNLVLEWEKYVSSLTAVLHYPWIVNIQIKNEGLELFSTRIIPKVFLKYFGIPTIRIVPSALVSDLQGIHDEEEIRYGFMAIDQARHVVFLKDELKNMDFCLVGMWVKGIHDVKKEFVKQLAVYYLMNRALSKLGSGFLICLFSQEPRFYQINYQLNDDDFWLQKAELNVSVSNSDQDIVMEFANVDIGKEAEFCKVYQEIRGIDLSVKEEEIVKDDTCDLGKVEESDTEAPVGQVEYGLKKECRDVKEQVNVITPQDEPEEDDLCKKPPKEEEHVSEKGSNYQQSLGLEHPMTLRITTKSDDSENQQQWVYLTLLQQQIDILRTQMMHLLNKDNNLNKVSVSTNTSSLSFQEYGTNTSFNLDIPEKKDQAVQVLIEEPVEITEKLETFLDIPDEFNIETDSKPPFDTGSNYKPFFSVSKVEDNIKEDKDSPETTFSKSMIAQLAQNPNASFIYESENAIREKELSQDLPDGSSINTTVLSAGHSFATQEYLRRHGLLNDSIISTVPATAQNSGIFLKPPRSSSDYKVLDSMRLKSLARLTQPYKDLMVLSTVYKVFRPVWISSIILSGVKASTGTEINTEVIKLEELRMAADFYLYLGNATIDIASHQLNNFPIGWIKKNMWKK